MNLLQGTQLFYTFHNLSAFVLPFPFFSWNDYFTIEQNDFFNKNVFLLLTPLFFLTKHTYFILYMQ